MLYNKISIVPVNKKNRSIIKRSVTAGKTFNKIPKQKSFVEKIGSVQESFITWRQHLLWTLKTLPPEDLVI